MIPQHPAQTEYDQKEDREINGGEIHSSVLSERRIFCQSASRHAVFSFSTP
jgi:hypothetical protein